MSNTVFAIMDICTLLLLGGLTIWVSWIKRKKKLPEKTASDDLTQIIQAQDSAVYHLKQALLMANNLLHNVGEMFLGDLTNLHNKHDLILAFKEATARINEHITGEKWQHMYRLIDGDCFADTSNCLLVLNEIVMNYNRVPIKEIVQEFKRKADK